MRRRLHGHNKGITAKDLEDSSQLFCDGNTLVLIDEIALIQTEERQMVLTMKSGKELVLEYDTVAKQEAAFMILLSKCYSNADEASY
jgi:hypothetical protein